METHSTKYSIDRTHIGYFGRLSKRTKAPTIIVIHHSDTRDANTTRRVLKGKGCSTHFEVEKDGHIYQYADFDEICQHCSGINHRAIGIDFTHKHKEPFTEAQMLAGEWLCKHICDATGIPCRIIMEMEPGIYPHNGIGNTLCPDGIDMNRLGQPGLTTLEAIRALFDLAKKEGITSKVRELIATYYG